MNRDPDPYRLYAIIRSDLDMSPGKISAQSGHAYLDAFLLAQKHNPKITDDYKTNHGIKIAMKAKNLHHLEQAYERATEAGIPAVLITDLGYFGTAEEHAGKATITALGIGPAKRSQVDPILKRFQLLK